MRGKAVFDQNAGAAEALAAFSDSHWRRSEGWSSSALATRPEQIDQPEYKAVVDNLPTLCWIADADGYITWYNRRWHEYCGTTPEQMEGWGWQSVHDPAVLPEVMAGWTGSIASGEPFEMVFPLRGADGVFRPFLTRIVPLRDDAGVIRRWVGNNVEIIRDRWPPIKIILTAAFFTCEDVTLPALAEFYPKPFRRDEIIAAMQRLARSAQVEANA